MIDNDEIQLNDNNLELIYAYTESILKSVNDDTNTINTKLGTIIAFTRVLIKITIDLPDQTLIINGLHCYFCSIIKAIIFMLLLSSIWVSTLGLTPIVSSSIAKPSELIENWYTVKSEVCKLFILKGLTNAVEVLDQERARKSNELNSGIKMIAVASTLIVIESLLISFRQINF